MRLRIFISGPITRGDLAANVNQATDAFVALAKAGLAPFCPHWSVYSGRAEWEITGTYEPGLWRKSRVVAIASPLPNDLTHMDWLAVDLPWVEVSDAVLRLPGESEGADREVAHAKKFGILVFHSVAAIIAWADSRKSDSTTVSD